MLPKSRRAAIAGGADIVQIREKELSIDLARNARVRSSMRSHPCESLVNGSIDDRPPNLLSHLHLPEAMTLDRCDAMLAPGALLIAVRSTASTRRARMRTSVAGYLSRNWQQLGKADLRIELRGARRVRLSGSRPCDRRNRAGMRQDVLRHGGHGVAVRSDVIGADDPERAARIIRQELDIMDEVIAAEGRILLSH